MDLTSVYFVTDIFYVFSHHLCCLNIKAESAEKANEKPIEKKEITASSDAVTAPSHVAQSNITRPQDSEKPTLPNVSNFPNRNIISPKTESHIS